jgi:ribosome assembly protein RRB1
MQRIYVSGSPCLSFDIIHDSLGEKRELHPLCAYVVAGTQAARTHTNNVLVMKVRKNWYIFTI